LFLQECGQLMHICVWHRYKNHIGLRDTIVNLKFINLLELVGNPACIIVILCQSFDMVVDGMNSGRCKQASLTHAAAH